MSVTDRLLAAIGVVAIVVLAAGAGTAAWLRYAYGTVELEVHSTGPGGDDVSIKLPGALVRIAAEFIPTEARRETAREIAAWLPVARAALSEFSHCPDARLVDVKSRGESVRISKRGKLLLAEITSPGESVRVSVPLNAARAVLDHLEGPADAPEEARTE
jgi:hypothetical protein